MAAPRGGRPRENRVSLGARPRQDDNGPAGARDNGWRGFSGRLDVEGFAAAALVLYVRIVELESFVEALAREIELGAVEIRQAFRIDDDVDAPALEVKVFGPDLVDEFELVSQPGASGRAHAQTQADPLAALLQEARDVLGRALGQGNRHACFA